MARVRLSDVFRPSPPTYVPVQPRASPSPSGGPHTRWPSRKSAFPLTAPAALPCVGCGWCCLTDQCRESHILYGYQERCPDLVWDENALRYLCRRAADPAFRYRLGIGEGCCAPLLPWRKDVRNRDREESGV